MPDTRRKATPSHPLPPGTGVATMLAESQRVLLGHALADAMGVHEVCHCAACDALPGDDLCAQCAVGFAISDAYLTLGRELGLPDVLIIGTPLDGDATS
jgi:hypothetical protein